MTKVVDFRIIGLDCAEEVAVLRSALAAREGVLNLDFDVLHARMSVSFETDLISESDIVSAVAATGMKARPWDRQAVREDFWPRRGREIMTLASGVLLATAFAVHWVSHGFIDALTAGGGHADHVFPPAVLLLYIGAIVAGAWFVAPRAIWAARRRRADMNLLMMIAVIGAAAIGEWFEAAVVAFLFSLALLLEQWSVGRARRAIGALLDISPPTANVIGLADHSLHETPVAQVPVDSIVLVRPGGRLPLDGVVHAGHTAVNQAPITGESMPVEKQPGDDVFAGTINGDGAIEVRVTRASADSVLARIIHMIEQAHGRRAQAQQWVDQFARYYTPAMIAVALAIAVVPPLVWGGWGIWLYRALVILVIACPCALVISTPVCIVSGLTCAARNGVLIKGGVFLELAGSLKAMAMDKTGTLTAGHPRVQTVVAIDSLDERELTAIAAALESHSEHPIARAITRYASETGVSAPAVERVRAVLGRGAQGRINGRDYWLGSHRLVEEKGLDTPRVHAEALRLEDAGHSVVIIGDDAQVHGLISVADHIRPESRCAVQDMKDAGLREVVMLTGDNEATARAIAAQAGVDRFAAELLPEDKVSAVEAMVIKHRRAGMIGDGINDAPAMAASTLGIAMATMGADAAIETADVALMSDDLGKVGWLIRHSRRTLTVIRQNIGFALGVKAVFITLAFMGLATLWMAIAADMGASLLVIFNGLRLLRGASPR
ncbi:MAG: cadmium-translocating P-type ATPase [Planctomycetes bacterium]|jgi:Cd2+/Zn2+-exporting ATPase|nr:cadmium-translocating P-type ATPase [Planctomycetota bacterium]